MIALGVHGHRTVRGVIRTMLRLLLAFLFFLPLLPFLIVVVTFALLVLFLVSVSGQLVR